jgi:hypothetical protein
LSTEVAIKNTACGWFKTFQELLPENYKKVLGKLNLTGYFSRQKGALPEVLSFFDNFEKSA